MEPYKVELLIEEAKVCLDENVSSEALTSLGDLDTLTLDEIIRSKVEDAARLVEESAAHYLLDNGKSLLGASISWESAPGYGAGRIMLPDDFMRLIIFQMRDWSYPVTEAITEESPIYPMQASRYAGVRGNPERPVVAIVHTGTRQQLEFYSCGAGAGTGIKTARYLPLPKVSDDGYIELPVKLHRAVVYRLASMAAAIIGASEQAAMLLGTSNELAGVITTNN
jgi:hypothetical protein